MNRTAIIKDILTRMDEILPPGESMSHPFDNYMNSVLDEAYRTAIKDYPIHLLDLSDVVTGGLKNPGSAFTGLTIGNIYIASVNGTGANVSFTLGSFFLATSATTATLMSVYDTVNHIAYIPMPENFERIGQFKFTDWVNPAKKHITQESQEFKIIENGAIAGGKVKPVVVLLHEKRSSDTTIKKYLACYSVTTIDANPKLWYVKYDKDAGLTSLSDNAIPGIVWKACSLLMEIFEMKGIEIAEGRYKAFLLSNNK